MSSLSRRALVRGAAWAAPVVAVSSVIPAYAASTCSLESSEIVPAQYIPDDLNQMYKNYVTDASDQSEVEEFFKSNADMYFSTITLSFTEEVKNLVVTATTGSFKIPANTYNLYLEAAVNINDEALWSIAEDGSVATYIGEATNQVTLYAYGEVFVDKSEAVDAEVAQAYAANWFAEKGYSQEQLSMLTSSKFGKYARIYQTLVSEGLNSESTFTDDKRYLSMTELGYVLGSLGDLVDRYWASYQEKGEEGIQIPNGGNIYQPIFSYTNYKVQVAATSTNCPSTTLSLNMDGSSTESTGS